MTAVSVSRNARIAIQVAQWIRNGKPVVADLQNLIADTFNYAAFVRARCVYRSPGALSTAAAASLVPTSASTRERGRFSWHAGPFASFIFVEFEMAQESAGTASDPYCTLAINRFGAAVEATAYMHAGSYDGAVSDVPAYFAGGITVPTLTDGGAQVFLTPDTDYNAVIQDVGTARLQSCAVWEVAIEPNTDDGYASNNHVTGSMISDQDRQVITEGARLLHTRGGPQLWNWHPIQGSGVRTLAGSSAVSGAGSWSLGALTIAGTGTSASTATFDSLISFPGTGTNSAPVDILIGMYIGGAAQTSGSVYVTITDNYGTNVIGGISTTSLNGWTESGWSLSAGIYTNHYTKASVSVGTEFVGVRITTGLNTGWLYGYTSYTAAPQTASATGVGNSGALHLTY